MAKVAGRSRFTESVEAVVASPLAMPCELDYRKQASSHNRGHTDLGHSDGAGAGTVLFKVTLLVFIRLVKFTQWNNDRGHRFSQPTTGFKFLYGG